ncbi:hypothetical protein [Flavivirga sp. 57AJ16]|uniref:hypothetical protein n=1 Tax=Flavivirga sp. 57AJ16 TaxID=3025307 RepID=UPI0023655F84|nr:hypothetical protein [Flavivirga sp. 57AJ16]MDD7885759.1 hypothetical protein [Flavivirga sp. 57AJ16]
MEQKFIIEGPDKKDRTYIIEVKEDKTTMTRFVQRFICEVCKQETPAKTRLLAYEILGKLNSKK